LIAAIDASVLLLMFDPESGAPLGPDGEPVDRCKDRVDHLVDRLSRSGGRLLVPSPALSELLVGAGPAGPEWMSRLSNKRAIRIVPFDALAAVECAALARDRGSRNSTSPRAKAKFDEQIVAIAKLHGAVEIYSDDSDIRKLASPDIAVIGVAELPLPPAAAQGSLDWDNFEPVGE
jgi:predicted nucleic acid-binding protein